MVRTGSAISSELWCAYMRHRLFRQYCQIVFRPVKKNCFCSDPLPAKIYNSPKRPADIESSYAGSYHHRCFIIIVFLYRHLPIEWIYNLFILKCIFYILDYVYIRHTGFSETVLMARQFTRIWRTDALRMCASRQFASSSQFEAKKRRATPLCRRPINPRHIISSLNPRSAPRWHWPSVY